MRRAEYVQPFGPLRPPFPFVLPPTKPYDEALVGDWRFYENVGVIAHDLSQSRNHGAINGATWVSVGKHGPALYFDGANDYVDLAGAFTSISGDDTFTIEGWFHADAWVGAGNIYCSAATGATRLYLASVLGKARVMRANVFSDEAGFSLLLGTWQHVTVVFTSNVNAELYVDGTFIQNLVVGAQEVGVDDINLGEYEDAQLGIIPFEGTIDEFRIYDRALPADEVRRRYEMYAGG